MLRWLVDFGRVVVGRLSEWSIMENAEPVVGHWRNSRLRATFSEERRAQEGGEGNEALLLCSDAKRGRCERAEMVRAPEA